MAFRQGLAWMGSAQLISFVVQFGSSVANARLLSPFEFGVFAIAAATAGIVTTIQALGLANFIVREKEFGRDLAATTFTVNAVLGVLVSLIIFAVSDLDAGWLGEAGVGRVLRLLAVLPIIGIFELLPAAVVQREGRFRLIALVATAKGIIISLATVAFAIAGFSSMSFAYAQLLGAVASALIFNLCGRQHIVLRLNVAEWRRVTRFGAQMLAISGAAGIAARANDFVLGKLLGLTALGLYSRANSVNSLLWDNIHLVFARVIFVDLAEKRRQGLGLRDDYLRIVEFMTALLWPAFAGMAVLAPPLIWNVYGPKWIDASPALSVIAISALIYVTITMSWELCVICDETARQARFELFRAVAGMTMFALGATYSLVAAASTRIIDSSGSVLYYRALMQRLTDTRFADMVPIYRRSALLTLLAAGPAAALMTFERFDPRTPLPLLLGAVAAGVLAWLAGLHALDHPLIDEAKRLRRRRPVAAPTQA